MLPEQRQKTEVSIGYSAEVDEFLAGEDNDIAMVMKEILNQVRYNLVDKTFCSCCKSYYEMEQMDDGEYILLDEAVNAIMELRKGGI